jgi:hypothetical protein
VSTNVVIIVISILDGKTRISCDSKPFCKFSSTNFIAYQWFVVTLIDLVQSFVILGCSYQVINAIRERREQEKHRIADA